VENVGRRNCPSSPERSGEPAPFQRFRRKAARAYE
jgi:hypothetical protein